MFEHLTKLTRVLGLVFVVAAISLLAAAPGALAETAESPGGSAEPTTPAAPAPTTGWAPEGGGTETSSDGAVEAQRGSSLGSGGAPQQSGSTAAQQTSAPSGGGGAPASTEPSYGGSSDYSEPSSSLPSSAEPTPSTPRAESGNDAGPAKSPAPAAKAADDVGVGTATRLAHSAPSRDALPAPSKATVPPAAPDEQAASGLLALPIWVVVVAGLVLLLVAIRGIRYLRSRRRRAQQKALWDRRQADWDTALSQIQLERMPGASEQSAVNAR